MQWERMQLKLPAHVIQNNSNDMPPLSSPPYQSSNTKAQVQHPDFAPPPSLPLLIPPPSSLVPELKYGTLNSLQKQLKEVSKAAGGMLAMQG